MLTGDTGDLPAALTRLSTTGLLRHETADALHGWIDACVAAGLVTVSRDQYRTLSLTPDGRDAMHGRAPQFNVTRPLQRRPLRDLLSDRDDDDDDDFDLYALRRRLESRRWRR